MKKLFFLVCITLCFCMCSCDRSSIVDAFVIKADTEVLGFGKIQSNKVGKYFVETDLARYDVNFVFSANSTTSRKIKICPKDGDGVTIFVMDETTYFIQGTCDKSYLDTLWANNIHFVFLIPITLFAFIIIVAFIAAFFEILGEKFNANKKSSDCDYDYCD